MGRIAKLSWVLAAPVYANAEARNTSGELAKHGLAIFFGDLPGDEIGGHRAGHLRKLLGNRSEGSPRLLPECLVGTISISGEIARV
jgi:hypothetical protein